MITLYLDTSSSYLYTAIIKEENILSEVKEKLDKDLSSFTLPKISTMFQQAELTPDDIDEIIVVNGPGSFTGIRIGVTIAKVYAWALKKEIKTISSLEAMALSATKQKFYIPVLDARRDYCFAGIYDQNHQIVLNNQYISRKELETKVKDLEEYIYISNDALNLKPIIKYDPNILEIVKKARQQKPINPHSIEPDYLKKTEAEENKEMEII